jgi:hypothetical protein
MHLSLKAYCATYDKDEDYDYFLSFTKEWSMVGMKLTGRNLSRCHFVYYKSHMVSPGIETGPPRWETGG